MFNILIYIFKRIFFTRKGGNSVAKIGILIKNFLKCYIYVQKRISSL